MSNQHSNEACIRINIILKLLKNKIEVDVFSTDEKVNFIEKALDELNSVPPISNMSFENMLVEIYILDIVKNTIILMERRVNEIRGLNE